MNTTKNALLSCGVPILASGLTTRMGREAVLLSYDLEAERGLHACNG